MIKDDYGNTFVEIPLNVACLGVNAASVLSAVGAVVTMISQFTVVAERADQEMNQQAIARQKSLRA
jgi:pyruvate/2-oxoglutarate dehydrogenase complex dihydrolipoamide dehydrogenase (E3) component